jgi:L-lactate utilization protein LutB
VKKENEKLQKQLQTMENLSKHYQTEQEKILSDHTNTTNADREKRQERAKKLQKDFDEVSKELEESGKEVLIATREREWLHYLVAGIDRL